MNNKHSHIKGFFLSEYHPYQKQILNLGFPFEKTINVFMFNSGIDVSNYNHEIDNSSIRHIKKNHPNIVVNDFIKIPSILRIPDEITYEGKNKQGLATIKYKKSFSKSIYYYIEEARTGKKSLSLKTMYKVKTPSGASLE